MASIEIIPSIYAHIAPVAIHMRQADRDEVWASSRKTPFEALDFSFRRSNHTWTVLIDYVQCAMFGVADVSVLAGIAAPWFLGTDEVVENRSAFLRGSVELRDQLLSRYPVLRNFVDARNRVAIRWLRWMGAEMSEPMQFNGHDFYMFEMRAK